MANGFGFDDIVDLIDVMTSYKSKQDAIALANRKVDLDAETALIIEEKKSDLLQRNEASKYNLGIQQSNLKSQEQEISKLKTLLDGWNVTYEDHLNLPEEFKSPDGESVIDEHTGTFKGKLFENVQAGHDTIDLINNFEKSVSYNDTVIDGLETIVQKYNRGQEFASKLGTDLMIDGIKDQADLGSIVQSTQKEYMEDFNNIGPDFTQEAFNSKWNNWQFITDQTIATDEDTGISYVVTKGDESSEFLHSPEWQGLMNQLAFETGGQVVGGSTWDANVSEFLQNTIDTNIKRLQTGVSKASAYNKVNKLTNNINVSTINHIGDFIDASAAGLNAVIGTDKKQTVGDDLYTGMKSLTNYISTRIQEGEYSYEANKDVLDMSNDILKEILTKGSEFSTPKIIKDMIANGDIDNAVSMLLYGAPREVHEGMFSADATGTGLPGVHNVFTTDHASHELNDVNGGFGGLYGAWDPSNISALDSGPIASMWAIKDGPIWLRDYVYHDRGSSGVVNVQAVPELDMREVLSFNPNTEEGKANRIGNPQRTAEIDKIVGYHQRVELFDLYSLDSDDIETFADENRLDASTEQGYDPEDVAHYTYEGEAYQLQSGVPFTGIDFEKPANWDDLDSDAQYKLSEEHYKQMYPDMYDYTLEVGGKPTQQSYTKDKSYQVKTGEWFLGLDYVMYNEEKYMKSDLDGHGINSNSMTTLLDYETGWGSDENNHRALANLLQIYEMVRNTDFNYSEMTGFNPSAGAGEHLFAGPYMPSINIGGGVWPDELNPYASQILGEINDAKRAKAMVGAPFSGEDLSDINKSLNQLYEYEEFLNQ